MLQFPGFTGPSNRQRSPWVDAEQTVNWYPHIVTAGTPKVQAALYPTPCIEPFAFLGSGPIRCLFAQDGRFFGVSGAYFYEILPSRNVIQWGTVIYNATPATICSNGKHGHQLFIVSGGEGYVFDTSTNTFSNITDTVFPDHCVSGLFFDGYFIGLSGADGRFQLSTLYDGFEWNALDFGLESEFSDQIVQMLRVHDTLWLFGTRNTAVWVNTGAANFPFAPMPGAIIEHGIAAPWSAVEVDNTVWWVGQDKEGGGVVWRANGYTPERVSSDAVEAALATVRDLQQVVCYGYQEIGHTFYVMHIPNLETTWVYDIATGQWHERGHWDFRYGRYIPLVGIHHAYAFGLHLVGDRRSGAVYKQSLDIYEDTWVA